MEILQSFILGIVQGITEFLPISSTAHLILVPWLLDWQDKGLPFNVALHFGSLFAIIFYFRREVADITTGFIKCVLSGKFEESGDGKLGFLLLVATVPAAVFAVLFEKYAAGMLRNPLFVAMFLSGFGILLYIAEKTTKREKSISQLNIVDSLFFGVAQAFAIIPGVSRSGVTITGGLFRNYKRDEAAKFSFLLGIPLIIGAAAFELRNIRIESLMSMYFLIGVFTSFVSAFLVIKYFLRYLKTNTFTPFVIYRILLSMVILYLNFYIKN